MKLLNFLQRSCNAVFICKKLPAFTLAELLMATLVMSIILTALAPVMTKRTLDNVNIGQTRNEKDGKLFLYNSMTEDLSNIWTHGSSQYHRYSFDIPEGVYSIDVYVQSAGGRGGRAMKPSYTVVQPQYYTSSAKATYSNDIVFRKGMYNFKIVELVGAGGGGGGSKFIWGAGPDSQEQCDSIASYLRYIPRNYNGGGSSACVTRRNVGDPGGPPIDRQGDCFKIQTAGDSIYYTSSTAGYCQDYVCFQGNTATNATSKNGYSGLNRTACAQPIAYFSCNQYRPNNVYFSLPTAAQAYDWHRYQINKGDLDLCSPDGSGNSARCQDWAKCRIYRDSGVGVSDWCAVNYMWTLTKSSATDNKQGSDLSYDPSAEYKTYIIAEGGWVGVNKATALHTASARCFTSPEYIRNISGGGGGAGATLKNYNIVTNPPDGSRFYITTGAGGAGGNDCYKHYASTDDNQGTTCTSGSQGGRSYVIYSNGSTGSTTTYYAYGGYGGAAAVDSSSSKSGGGGGSGNSSCYSSSACYSGGSGSSGRTDYMIYKYTPQQNLNSCGGNGGGASDRYGTSGNCGSGSASNASNSHSYWGAGGGGGGVRYWKDANSQWINHDRRSGGYGANGYAKLKYEQITRRPSGGGGGGGAFTVLQGIPVQPGYVVEVYVGGGGRPNSSYPNGGESGVKVMNSSGSTVMQYILSGGVGGQNGDDAISAGFGRGGDGGKETTCNNCSAYKKIYKKGKNGSSASYNQHIDNNGSFPYMQSGVYMGGNGGASGTGTPGGYGGFYTQWLNGVWNHVNSSNANGLEVDFKAPSMIFGAMDYGTTGAGGGGGGWSWGALSRGDHYSQNNEGVTGNGAKGQDGYVFIMWDKPPEP